ncbi:MAG: tRNA pseudouridine(38-40) synthase TruA [Verrucomicrobiales bacterium]
MTRYKLTLAYDGRPFSGWQSQRGGNTIQDVIERAVASLSGQPARVHASGRTDAGVHALGQVAHFDPPAECRLNEMDWHRGLNALLPPTIRVMRCEQSEPDFHSRFDVRGKVYRYRLWHGEVLPPLESGLAWHLYGPLDGKLLREAAHVFKGRHDFTVFSANRREEAEEKIDKIRTLHEVTLFHDGELIELTFGGDGFLYKMVRMIVGAAVHAARGRTSIDRLLDLLKNPQQKKPGWQAPADGLYLVRVDY